jgi:hypothetical protein
MLNGSRMKTWTLKEGIAPRAWALDDERPVLIGGSGIRATDDAPAEIVDARPHVEIPIQLRALRGEQTRQ